ncbi:uncharacterized protein Tco025E_00704 [Trypanosoma conorhini]|uniref:Uncharacterized protein n=1 Tax=Trypanosoma conorhini TaxID=83891 RepID=A0A3R7M5L8_9TRYP|nr:uncharacterized protein Tco025E_00704 [Trypanosoma conorhini]RNF27020.1 hypothetical protein Tco025E_00704 [Trypanosoma conorhini]
MRMPCIGEASRLCAPQLQCVLLAVFYLHCLFIPALLGQNVIAALLLVLNLIFAARYEGHRLRHRTSHDGDAGNDGVEDVPTRFPAGESTSLLPILLPPRYLLYVSLFISCIQLLLAATLGWLLGHPTLRQEGTKAVLNSFGVWGGKDFFPLTVNVVSSVFLAATSAGLCVILRQQHFKPSLEPNRSFHRSSLLCLAVLATFTSSTYPAYDHTPVFAAPFLLMISFLLPLFLRERIRVVEVTAKGCALLGLLLLVGGLSAQSPVVQRLLLEHQEPSEAWSILWYERNWVKVFQRVTVLRKGVQFLLLTYTILAARYVHGSWRCISMRELEEHREYFYDPPFLLWQIFTVRYPAQVKRMQRLVGHYLPRATVPLMIFLSFMVMDLVSVLMIITSLFGFVLSSGAYVVVLPFCYVAVAAGVVLEFVATVDSRLQQLCFMVYVGTGMSAFVTRLAQCGVNSLLVLAVCMFRANPTRRQYRALAEKKAHIQKAFARLHGHLEETRWMFEQVCDSATGTVSRGSFAFLVGQVVQTTHLKETDVDSLWRFLTAGESVLLHSGPEVTPTGNQGALDAVVNSDTVRNPPSNLPTARNGEREASVRCAESTGGVRDDGNEEAAADVEAWDKTKKRCSPSCCTGAVEGRCTSGEKEVLSREAFTTTLVQGLQSVEEYVRHAGPADNSEDESRRQRRWWPGRRTDAFCSTRCAAGSPGGSIAYLDFLVLVSEVESYRMQHCSRAYVAAAMLRQIIYLNTSTLSLVAMFAVSMAVQQLDILNGMYLLFFLGLACAPRYILHCWPIIVAYTTLHIAGLFIVMVYNASYHPNVAPSAWMEVTGIFISRNPFLLLVYFFLLLLAVLQMRFSRRELSAEFTIREVLERMEWRCYMACAFFPQFHQNVLILSTALLLVMMTLFIPHNVFIAGFALLFLLYLSLGAYSQLAESGTLLVLGSYNVMVLFISALYHVPVISNAFAEQLSHVAVCHNITVRNCALEVGLSLNNQFGAVSLELLPWYLAAALCVALCRHRFGALARGRNRRQEEGDHGRGAEAMEDLNAPLIASRGRAREEEEEDDAEEEVETMRSNPALHAGNSFMQNDGENWMELFFCSYIEMRGTFLGRCVPLAFEVSRYLSLGLACIRKLGARRGELLLWASLLYASLADFSVLGAAFMALFLTDSRGIPVVIVAVASMALNYVYPFFFIPEVPLSASASRFFGLQKRESGERWSILSPLLVCAAAVFYAHTKKCRSDRHQQDAQRQGRMSENPRHRVHAAHDEMQSTHKNEELRTTYVPFADSQEQSETVRGVRAPQVGFVTLHQHLIFMWSYFRTRFLLDAAFELTVLVVVLGLALTLDHATGLVFILEFFLMWLIGRVRSTTEFRYAMPQELLMVLALAGSYLVRLGLPEGWVGVSVLHPEECGAWDHYFGCRLPLHHFVLMTAVVVMQRCMRQGIAEVRATIPSVEGALELGELLCKKAKAVEDCQKLLRADIENVLPVSSRDIIRNPRTLFELVISLSCVFLPAAALAFVQGVAMSSLLGVLEIVASLWILTFKRYLAWRSHKIWPFFTLFLFLTFVPQLVARLPLSPPAMTRTGNLMFSLGFSPWSQGTIVGQALVLFLAVVQQRFFSEFFFAAYLIGLCKGSLAAVGRHKEMIGHFRRRDAAMRRQIHTQEAALRRKLEELFAERNMHARRVEPETEAPTVTGREDDEAEKGEKRGELSSGRVWLPTAGSSRARSPWSAASRSDTCLDAPKTTEERQSETHQQAPTGADAGCPGPASNGEASDGAAEKVASPIHEEDKEGIFGKLSEAIGEWLEQLVQYLSSRTYRGKAPRRTYSQGYRLLVAFTQFLLRRSSHVCYILFMLNYALSGTLLDMLLSLSAALYGMLILPWSGRCYWRNALIYNVVSILAKCVMQVVIQNFAIHPTVLYLLSASVLDIGLDRTAPSSRAMTLDIVMDFIVFLGIILHLQLCSDYGVFAKEHELARRPSEGEEEAGEVHKPHPHREQGNAASRSGSFDEDAEKCDLSRAAGTMSEEERTHQTPSAQNLKTNTKEGESTSINTNNNDYNGSGHYSTYQTWRDRATHKSGVVHNYWSNVCTRHGTGSDCYTLQFWSDSVSLIAFAVVYFILAGDSSGSILHSVQQDLLPGPLVLILFVGVLLVAAERIVYVLHSVQLKFGLHFLTTLAYHCLFMAWRLTLAHRTTTPAVMLLLIRFFSLIMSALQLQQGFPLHRKHDPFTTHTNIFHYLGHVVYRSIPFLFELRLLLDWSVSPTALKLQHWMFLEDVHHTVYMRYVDISDLAWTSPKKGRQFPFLVRGYQGVVGFAACLLVLFFPLALYSTFSPNVAPNLVKSWRTKMLFGTTSHFYAAEGTDVPLSPTVLPELWNALPMLRQDGYGSGGLLQLLVFPSCSAEVWSATPETRLLLLGQLNAAAKNETVFVIHKQDDVVRRVASAGATRRLRVRRQYVVPWGAVVRLRDALEKLHLLHASRRLRDDEERSNSTATLRYEASEWIPLPQFYDPFVDNLPSAVVVKERVRGECEVQLNSVGGSDGKAPPVLYWCVRCRRFANLTGGPTDMAWNGDGVKQIGSASEAGAARRSKAPWMRATNESNMTNLFEVVASSDVALDSSLVFLPNTGIIALYTTFILALGTFLRNAVTGYAHRVVLMQVANPDPIAELLRYIYMTRSLASNGYVDSLLLEQQLFFELVDMLRSPERVLSLSGRRVNDYDACGRFQNQLKKSSESPF